MVIDNATVVTGSFNFTVAAQSHNAENLVVIEDRALAAKYRGNWERRRAMSLRFGAQAEIPSVEDAQKGPRPGGAE
jgi:phosphatidylserine/phosphatidylglycerophosphate/cardiolipin synthase-like enzyme